MKKYNLFIILILFLLIYEPPVINVNVLHIIGVISWIYIFFNEKVVIKAIKIQKVYKMYFAFLFIWIYIAFIAFVNGNSILQTVSFIFWLIDILPACVMICTYFMKRKYTIYDFLNILLIVGAIQSVFAITAFLIPEIQSFFVNRLISYGYGDVYVRLSSFRMYGFASNLTYSTPIVQSILTVIAIYLSINKNWKYILVVPFMFLSAVINARISIVIIIIGLMSLIFLNKTIKIKSFSKFIFIFLIIIITTKYGVGFMKDNAPDTYYWVMDGVNEIYAFFKGDFSNGYYFGYISDTQRYTLPDNYKILFGVGQGVMGSNKYGISSDIGYVNDIWMGGVFYCILIYGIFSWFLFSFLKGKQFKIDRFFFLLFSATFIFSNIKGSIFSRNNYTTLFFLFYFFIVLCKENISCSKSDVK